MSAATFEPNNDTDFKIKLNVTHSIMTGLNLQELRFDRRLPLIDIKKQLEQKCGSKSQFMTLHLRDQNGVFMQEMSNLEESLQFYGAQDYFEIHVIDSDPDTVLKDLANPTEYVKYEISDEDYDKREKTFRKFKQQMLAQNPGFMTQNQHGPTYQQAEASVIQVGQRCKTMLGGNRLGEVMYVGLVPTLGGGYWVGVKLDEPTGNTNGSCGGHIYFQCIDGFGQFFRPLDIQIGDFPPEDTFDYEEDMI